MIDNVLVKIHQASFRDPSAYVYEKDGVIYRKINEGYFLDFNQLMDSGLYEKLTSLGHLIRHKVILDNSLSPSDKHIVLQPEIVRHISYPYEWCFSQLKDAAIKTIEICKIAIDFDMVLKDANAYNIQFHNFKPVLIDTCSFEQYEEGTAWVAYQQFCKHFLAPLALMAKVDVRLNSLFKNYIDGIPLDLASKMLPLRSWFSYSLLAHIHIHSKFQVKYGDAGVINSTHKKISKNGLLGILSSLEQAINNLEWRSDKTEWGDYYNNTNYSSDAVSHKEKIIKNFVSKISPSVIWDLGGNNGTYSRIAASTGASVVCWDIDSIAVENNYIEIKNNCEKILPLIQDLTNPSSGIGWSHNERDSLEARAPVDMILSLALIHHLTISNNIPFIRVAEYFSKLGIYLLIEFVPKNDSQVEKLLTSRKDIFQNYNLITFEKEFSKYYEVTDKIKINDSSRYLFLMKRKGNKI